MSAERTADRVKLELQNMLTAVSGNHLYTDNCVRLIDELVQLRIAEAFVKLSSGGK